ncbi:MAG TPA: SRPBCC domain-containing protein [Chitinophagaceae bacterium]|nr:SRPBCC domain-containing protein [Chitinophagaceae bacterium]
MIKDDSENRKLRITKTFNASVELAWEAWTNPKEIVHWWAPTGFTTTILKMDVREGEEWLMTLHGPDGKNYPNKSIFREIIPLRKIVYEHLNPDFVATVLFEQKDNKTVMDWSMLFDTAAMRDIVVKTFNADEGLKQNVEKLENYLSQKHHNDTASD